METRITELIPRNIKKACKTIGVGYLDHPYGLGSDHDDNIYVADTYNHRIQVFNKDGNYIRTLGIGIRTSGNEGFNFPVGLALDNVDYLYVADR